MIHEIIDNIYIGNWRDASDCEEYNSEFIIFTVAEDSKYKNDKYFYKLIDGGDDIDEPTKVEFLKALNDLTETRNKEPKEQKILVHCIQGISRSSSVIAGYIIKKYNIKAVNALQYIKSIKYEINPAPKFIKMLNGLENGSIITSASNKMSNDNKIQNQQTEERLKKFYLYLLPELSKLKNEGDAKNFLSKAKARDLKRLNISITPDKLTEQFNTSNKITEYLYSLSYYQIVPLTKLLSKIWRKNKVYDNLINTHKWEEKDIPINNIYVSFTERSVEHIFKKNKFKLSNIVKDLSLWMYEPYSKLYKGREIEFPICLAKKIDDSTYMIFDGIHRAIQIAFNEQEYITLYYTEVANQQSNKPLLNTN